MAKYDALNYAWFAEFVDSLLQQDRAHFQTCIERSKLISHGYVQFLVDADMFSSVVFLKVDSGPTLK